MHYQATGSRDPVWAQVTCDPDDALANIAQENFQGVASANPSKRLNPQKKQTNAGLNVFSAAVLITGEMAGSGVLALPKAVVNSGWIGLVLLAVFCFSAGYSGVRLGQCWDILEERYQEHRGRTRDPYATVARRAAGKWAGRAVSGCIQVTLFGAGAVYLLLAAQSVREVLRGVAPQAGLCAWLLALGALLAPAMWLGTPRDFWWVGVGATLSTALACLLMLVQAVRDGLAAARPAPHGPHSLHELLLALGTLLFAFGGASTFPTIQNDMQDRSRFPRSVAAALLAVALLYLPLAAAAYWAYGDLVQPNVALSLAPTVLVRGANALMAAHLVLAFLIVVNPVSQELEQAARLPAGAPWRRCGLRSGLMLAMLLVAGSVPQFGQLLALVGGSTVALLTFVFPSWFYMRLCDRPEPGFPPRPIPLHHRAYMWELIGVGLLGGAAATYSAVRDILGPAPGSRPCCWS